MSSETSINACAHTECLPPNDAWRTLLHNEVHARPAARVRMPALVTCVAVLNKGVTRQAEWAHLRALPEQAGLQEADVAGNFLRVRWAQCSLKWERHAEFSRYSIVQPLPAGYEWSRPGAAQALGAVAVAPEWLRACPGQTIAAVQLVMVHGDVSDEVVTMGDAVQWFDGRTVVASQMGGGHSWAVTDFQIQADGFERILVIAPESTTQTRAGRVSMRLLEMEIYRMMALRGLPVAKAVSPMLSQTEDALAALTADMEHASHPEQALLDQLIALAAKVERATAEHDYRFSATSAYDGLVNQRIAELREKPIPGTQTIGEFMRRRLSPAMATVAATRQRLASVSERIARTSALMRTRVDMATEAQNQQLLAKLTRGQDLQLRLQSTVEGLSIAAISYYVVSLVLYGAKSLKSLGLPIHPEMSAGALIPVVLWVVWRTNKRIHDKLHAGH